MALPRWNTAPVVVMARPRASAGRASCTASFRRLRPPHYQHHALMPPGAIGSAQLQRGMPWVGYFQPVEITGRPVR